MWHRAQVRPPVKSAITILEFPTGRTHIPVSVYFGNDDCRSQRKPVLWRCLSYPAMSRTKRQADYQGKNNCVDPFNYRSPPNVTSMGRVFHLLQRRQNGCHCFDETIDGCSVFPQLTPCQFFYVSNGHACRSDQVMPAKQLLSFAGDSRKLFVTHFEFVDFDGIAGGQEFLALGVRADFTVSITAEMSTLNGIRITAFTPLRCRGKELPLVRLFRSSEQSH